jgi:hypothetical protein
MTKIIFLYETQVVIGQNNSESVWRKASEKWKPYCLNQHKMKTKVSFVFLGVHHSGIGSLVSINGN